MKLTDIVVRACSMELDHALNMQSLEQEEVTRVGLLQVEGPFRELRLDVVIHTGARNPFELGRAYRVAIDPDAVPAAQLSTATQQADNGTRPDADESGLPGTRLVPFPSHRDDVLQVVGAAI